MRQELEERSTLCEELRQQNNELALALQESEGKAEKELRAKRIELANSMEMREMLEARIEELEQQLQSQKKNEELYQALVGMKEGPAGGRGCREFRRLLQRRKEAIYRS